MRTRLLPFAILAATTLLLAGSNAHALSINSTSSVLGQAVGCTDSACAFGSDIYSLTSAGPISGDIEVINGGTQLQFDITLSSATLTAAAGDGGVSSVDLSNVLYSGTVDVTLGANYIVDGGQGASVTGSVTANPVGSSSAIAAVAALVTGQCSGTPGVDLNCGLTFGAPADFTADVNGNTRYFQTTVNVFATIPEPGTAVLMGLGLLGLAARRERD